MTIDRSDLLAVLGVVAIVVGIILVHPALLLIAGGYLAVTYTRRAV